MPQNLFGLPTHILLLHVVVVLLPVAAVLTAATALLPRFRHRYGVVVVAFTFVTTLFVPLTTQAGEALAVRLPDNPAIARHAATGNLVTIWAALFGLCLAALVGTDLVRRATVPAAELGTVEGWAVGLLPAPWRRDMPGWSGPALRVAQALAIVTAIGVTAMVIKAGHTGAQAVWTNYPHLQAAP